MAKVLILFAHPRLEKSRSNRVLIQAIPDHPDLTFRDLYELYPDFNIDITREEDLLLQHDILVWHHPLYWYSCPALLKQWIDLVLEYGWAYGPGGQALKGKMVFNVFTSGGKREVYQHGMRNRFTIREYFQTFDQTARFCKMRYLPPFGVMGTHLLSDDELSNTALDYRSLLQHFLHDDFDPQELETFEFLNDWLAATKTV